MNRMDSIAVKPKVVKRPRVTKAKKPDHLHRWALAGVSTTYVMSAGLNIYASYKHSTLPSAGIVVGLAIPTIVLLLAKGAGLVHRRGQMRLAATTAGVGAGLLALSIWHCALSIADLTGQNLWLSVLMSLAIDAGLVCFELMTLLDD